MTRRLLPRGSVPVVRMWRAGLCVLAIIITLIGGLGAEVAGAALADPPQASASVPDASARADAGRVVIVSLPTIRWAEIERHQPPAILDVVRRSAIASMSVRTIGATTSPGKGYATIGAGNRATAPSGVAGLAFEPDFRLERGDAAEVFARRTGETAEGAAVVQIGVAQVEGAARRMRYGAEPGALGQALADEGRSAAVVANADLPEDYHREAALGVMDRFGRVAGGSVADDLLQSDPESAFGVRLDPDRTAAAVEDALADNDLVLVEASDLVRLDAYNRWMTPDARRDALVPVLDAADELVAKIAGSLDPDRDLLMLLAPTAPSSVRHEQLTMFAMAGPGIDPGFARSGTTRRDGFVTLPDVAPTVLDHLGVPEPSSMNGAQMGSDGNGAPSDGDIDRLVAHNEIAVFRDQAFGPITVVYIVLQILLYALVTLALTRWSRLRGAAWFGCLIVLAIPPVGFLWGLVRYDNIGMPGFAFVVLLSAVVLALLATPLARWHLLGPPVALIGLGLVVLLGDVLAGGWLQIRSVFGYSPIVAGRFAGFGNLAYAMVASCAVVVATALWAIPRMRGPEGRLGAERRRTGWPLWLAAAVLFATLVVVGMPAWGSDVGGVIASVPAFAVVVLLLAGVRVGLGRVALIGVVTVAVLAGFAALDLSRPPADRTHLSRFVESALDGGGGTILVRKIEANISILTSSTWSLLVPVGLAFLAFLTWRRHGMLQDLQRRVPGLRACLVGGLLVSVLGMAANDSGVAVPAMAGGVLLPYIAYLIVRVDGHEVLIQRSAGRVKDGDEAAGTDEVSAVAQPVPQPDVTAP